MGDITTIQITKQLRDDLKELGKKGESYNEIISRMVRFFQKKHFYNEMDQIMDEEGSVSLNDL